MNDVRVVQLGQDTAMICYSVEAQRDAQTYNALISSVWLKVHNDWKMSLHQQTPI